MGAAGTRPSLRPRCFEGHDYSISSGALRREHEGISTVIPGRCESIEPGISRFPDAQLRI